MPILSLLVGCGAQLSTEWRIAFYNPEASRTEFVMDYKECHVSAHSKGMLKSGVPIRTYIWYEWLEKDRASIYMTYHAQSEYLTTAYEKSIDMGTELSTSCSELKISSLRAVFNFQRREISSIITFNGGCHALNIKSDFSRRRDVMA
jgi:hypothetical protein